MVNSINMPVSRERMEQYQNIHMRQIEHAAKQWDAGESQSKDKHYAEGVDAAPNKRQLHKRIR